MGVLLMSAGTKNEKIRAAEKSLEYVENGMRMGLGSGSTAAIMIQLLGRRVRDGLQVEGIPTSVESERLAEEAGIPLLSQSVACAGLVSAHQQP